MDGREFAPKEDPYDEPGKALADEIDDRIVKDFLRMDEADHVKDVGRPLIEVMLYDQEYKDKVEEWADMRDSITAHILMLKDLAGQLDAYSIIDSLDVSCRKLMAILNRKFEMGD